MNQPGSRNRKQIKKQNFETQKINQEKNYIHQKLTESSLVAQIH